jgi:hypothetical protein
VFLLWPNAVLAFRPSLGHLFRGWDLSVSRSTNSRCQTCRVSSTTLLVCLAVRADAVGNVGRRSSLCTREHSCSGAVCSSCSAKAATQAVWQKITELLEGRSSEVATFRRLWCWWASRRSRRS